MLQEDVVPVRLFLFAMACSQGMSMRGICFISKWRFVRMGNAAACMVGSAYDGYAVCDCCTLLWFLGSWVFLCFLLLL